jgi:hypothetical protein
VKVLAGVFVMTDAVVDFPKSASIAKKWGSIKAALRIKGAPDDNASFHMMNLCKSNLGVRLSSIDETSFAERQKEIHKTVDALLKTGILEWDDIYRAESMIALLYGGEQLREEIKANLQELEKHDKVEADTLTQRYDLLSHPVDGPKRDDASLHLFLLRVLEAVHINLKKTYLGRPIRLQATNRILQCLLFSFCLLILPYVLVVFDSGDGADGIITVGSKYWSLFALYTALTAGLLGAFSSRLNGIQSQWANMNLDEVFLQREWSYTFLRAGVGVCGALIVYIFLRSGIAEGALFPKFDEIKIELIHVSDRGALPMAFAMPSKALALLTFWCFLAGFSETLVGGMLKSTEQQLTEAATPGKASRK